MQGGRHRPARQAFTAQLGKPDKEADVSPRVNSARRRAPGCHGNRGGLVSTRMKTAPRICALLSAFQRAGCEGKGGMKTGSSPRPVLLCSSRAAGLSPGLSFCAFDGEKKADRHTDAGSTPYTRQLCVSKIIPSLFHTILSQRLFLSKAPLRQRTPGWKGLSRKDLQDRFQQAEFSPPTNEPLHNRLLVEGPNDVACLSRVSLTLAVVRRFRVVQRQEGGKSCGGNR